MEGPPPAGSRAGSRAGAPQQGRQARNRLPCLLALCALQLQEPEAAGGSGEAQVPGPGGSAGERSPGEVESSRDEPPCSSEDMLAAFDEGDCRGEARTPPGPGGQGVDDGDGGA